MSDKWIYYEKDQAYFRKPADFGDVPFVTQVRHGNKWVPFDGDAQAPVFFGSRVSEEEATEGMEAEPEHPDAVE
jgi:hypothetical protein